MVGLHDLMQHQQETHDLHPEEVTHHAIHHVGVKEDHLLKADNSHLVLGSLQLLHHVEAILHDLADHHRHHRLLVLRLESVGNSDEIIATRRNQDLVIPEDVAIRRIFISR